MRGFFICYTSALKALLRQKSKVEIQMMPQLHLCERWLF